MDGSLTDTHAAGKKTRTRRTYVVGVMVTDYRYTATFRMRIGRKHYLVGYDMDKVADGKPKAGTKPLSVTPCDPSTPPMRIRVDAEEVKLIREHLKRRRDRAKKEKK